MKNQIIVLVVLFFGAFNGQKKEPASRQNTTDSIVEPISS